MTRSALVIDYIAKSDSRHDGSIIRQTLKNIGWDVALVNKPSKQKFLEKVYKAWTQQIVHISAHGNDYFISKSQNGLGAITIDEIRDYFLKRLKSTDKHLDDTILVVNSACNTASRDWQDLFINSLHVKNYVGVQGEPSMKEGILFPTALYLELWDQRERLVVKLAFERAKALVNTEATWQLFPER